MGRSKQDDMTVAQAAAKWGVSGGTVRRWIRMEKIEVRRMSERIVLIPATSKPPYRKVAA